jgi:hypothetical protein
VVGALAPTQVVKCHIGVRLDDLMTEEVVSFGDHARAPSGVETVSFDNRDEPSTTCVPRISLHTLPKPSVTVTDTKAKVRPTRSTTASNSSGGKAGRRKSLVKVEVAGMTPG